MTTEHQEYLTPETNPPLPWLTPFGLWVIAWLAITAAVCGWWLYDKITTRIVTDDWPDGYSSHADHWHTGVFLEHKADRIRRFATYHGDRLDSHSKHYFVSIPMDQETFERELGNWRSSSGFRESTGKTISFPTAIYRPDWLPIPSPVNHIGTISEFSETYDLYRFAGDDRLYLILSP